MQSQTIIVPRSYSSDLYPYFGPNGGAAGQPPPRPLDLSHLLGAAGDLAVTQLQQQVNRFAGLASFVAVALTGELDAATTSALVRVVLWNLEQRIGQTTDPALVASWKAKAAEIVRQTQTPAAAAVFFGPKVEEVTHDLKQIADGLHLPLTPAPRPQGISTGIKVAAGVGFLVLAGVITWAVNRDVAPRRRR